MSADTEENMARKRPNTASIKLSHEVAGEDAEGQRDPAPDDASVLGQEGEDEAVADTGECAHTRGGAWPSTFGSTRDAATDALGCASATGSAGSTLMLARTLVLGAGTPQRTKWLSAEETGERRKRSVTRPSMLWPPPRTRAQRHLADDEWPPPRSFAQRHLAVDAR